MASNAAREFWPDFSETGNFREIDCDYSGSLASDVLDTYNISCANPGIGGSLGSLDIKHMDALNVIKLSLLEYGSENGGIYEAIVNHDGEVEFVDIGSSNANVSDVYYTIQTLNYREPCNGVLITGGKPITERLPIDWKLIWGDSREIFHTHDMVSNCSKANFSTHATIVFNDPHLDSTFEDGIDNLYDISIDNNPWAKIIGYAYYKDVPDGLVTKDTTISYTKQAIIPLKVASSAGGFVDIGTLQTPPTMAQGEDEDCFVSLGSTAIFSNGIPIEIPETFRYEDIRNTTVDKFAGVKSVFIVGKKIKHLRSVPPTDADGLDTNPSKTAFDIYAWIDESVSSVYRLEDGKHYSIAYDEESQGVTPYVVFANNIAVGDPHEYGRCSFKINPYCEYYQTTGDSLQNGTILPTSPTEGILVEEVWASVQISTPSIVVYDPDGTNNRALTIAENLKYYIGAMMIEERPAPIAFNGNLIDQLSSRADHDPTTAQNFRDTDLENALDRMEGGGLSLTLSFLDGAGSYQSSENQVKKLSRELFDVMNSGNGVHTTYVCGPECNPVLGARGNSGGIVNNITYSYSDSNSYMVSVTEGPYLVGGLAQINGGVYMKATEEVAANGTVLQDLGNHIHYKVHIDEFGDRVAINCQHEILRVGDKVSCAIHNCPVEM